MGYRRFPVSLLVAAALLAASPLRPVSAQTVAPNAAVSASGASGAAGAANQVTPAGSTLMTLPGGAASSGSSILRSPNALRTISFIAAPPMVAPRALPTGGERETLASRGPVAPAGIAPIEAKKETLTTVQQVVTKAQGPGSEGHSQENVAQVVGTQMMDGGRLGLPKDTDSERPAVRELGSIGVSPRVSLTMSLEHPVPQAVAPIPSPAIAASRASWGTRIRQATRENARSVRSLFRSLRTGVPEEGALGDRHLVMLLAAWNFLTVGSYYIIRPIKQALVVYNQADYMQSLSYLASPFFSGLVGVAFGMFAFMPRKKLMSRTILLLTSLFAVWAAAMVWAPPLLAWALGAAKAKQVWGFMGLAYYLWGDAHIAIAGMMVGLYANLVFSFKSTKRFFGPIVAGASLGGLVFSLVPEIQVKAVGYPGTFLIAGAVYGLSWFLFQGAERLAGDRGITEGMKKKEKGQVAQTAEPTPWTRYTKILAALLVAQVFLEKFLPAMWDWIIANQWKMDHPASSKEDFIGFRGQYTFYQSMAAMLLNALLVPLLITSFGASNMILFTSVMGLAGFAIFAAFPTAGVAVAFGWLDGLQRYTWFKSAKESMTKLLGDKLLRKVKPLLDTFPYRAGSSLAGILTLIVPGTFLGVGLALGKTAGLVWLAYLAIPMAAVGVGVAFALRRLEKKRPLDQV